MVRERADGAGMTLRDYLFYEEPGITLYCGDCREVLPLLPRESIDLLVTDPPYLSPSGSIKARDVWARNWGDYSIFTRYFKDWLGDVAGPLKTAGSVYVFCDVITYPALFPALYSFADLVQMIVWKKPSMTMGAYYRPMTELVIYARRPESPWYGDKGVGNVIESAAVHSSEREHASEKPLEVIRPLIENSSAIGDCVLDTFAGSASTLITAKEMGRRAIGIEIEPKYCDIAVKRLRQEILPLALPVPGGGA